MKINLFYNKQLSFSKKKSLKLNQIFILFSIFLIQSCTSGVEVAANLGKKYLIPKEERAITAKPIYKIGNKYNVKGKFYFPKKDLSYNKTGIASWYGPKFHGKLTANGEIYNQYALTAAHKTLPLPSAVKVTNLQNNKSIILRINDRGPFVNDRIIDLSSKAADILDLKENGTGLVRVTILKDKSLLLEKLAKNGSFPEIMDLPKAELPTVNIPQTTIVKIDGTNKKYKSVILRINDRGPFVNDRIIDLSSKAADILDLKKNGTGLVRVILLKDKSLLLEKLAKNGSFPEIEDLPKPELPKVNIPISTTVKIDGTSKKNKSVKKVIKYDLNNLKKKYNIFIQIASFSSSQNAKIMKEKVSYIEKVKIYKKLIRNKTFYQVKAGPFESVKKVDELHSLLLQKGMQGAKIIIE